MVQSTPEGHASFPARLNNLGSSFMHHFEWKGDMKDIAEAIQHQQYVVQLAPYGHADLPDWFTNLGTSFLCLFKQNGDLWDISNISNRLPN